MVYNCFMRIGIYDPYLDDLGGGEKYMMTLALCLTGKHEVTVFWDHKEDVMDLAKRFGMDVSRIKITPNIFTQKTSFLKRFLSTRKYDAIVFLSDGSIPFVGSKKLFLHIQQPLPLYQSKSVLGSWKISRVTEFFSNSEYTKSFLQKNFTHLIRVLYPPVAISSKNKIKKNIILHVGRFRVIDALTKVGDFKKQGFMIDAFKEMVDHGLKNWEFELAVSVMEKDREAFETLRRKAEGYPIRFFINKTNNELWDIYSTAKIYWHASGFGEDLIKHPEYAEHFGISTVEAMGAGAVPVVINSGGQKEIVTNEKDGLLWNSKKELQEKTLQLTKDMALLKKLSYAAKKRAANFSKEQFCKAVNAMIA